MANATDLNNREKQTYEADELPVSSSGFYSASVRGSEARERLMHVLKDSLTYTYSTSDSPQVRLERLNHLVNDLVDEVIRLQAAVEEKEAHKNPVKLDSSYQERQLEQKRTHWITGLALSVTTLFAILAASLLLKTDDIGGRFATYFFAGITGSASAEAFKKSFRADS